MSDYTQQEVEDMFGKITGMFDHIRNTFVNASDLAVKVAALEQRVTELSDQAEAMRQHNINLDEALAHTRKERDEAQGEAARLRQELVDVTAERDNARQGMEYWQGQHATISDTHEKTKQDLHTTEEYAAALEQENESLKAQLAKLKEAFGNVFGAEPKPAESPPVQGWPQQGYGS